MTLRFLTILTLLLSFSCDDELKDCYETVCSGPDNTDCREDPVLDSGCFPLDNGTLQPE